MLKAEHENIALATERKNQNILRKEIAWIRRGARARSTKQKAHIKRYEALAAEEMIEADKTVNLSSIASRLGNKTIELHNISKAFQDLPTHSSRISLIIFCVMTESVLPDQMAVVNQPL